MPKAKSRGPKRFNPWNIKGITSALVGQALKYGVPATQTYYNNKKKSEYKSGVTTQHDSKLQYRKKRMPKRKRKQWKNFVRKVQAVNLKDRGLVTAVYNTSVTNSTASEFGQVVSAIHLYGFRSAASASEPGCNDIGFMMSADAQMRGDNVLARPVAVDTDVTEINKYATEKIQLESAILDYTFTNTSNSTIEVDVYLINYRKTNKANFNLLYDVFNTAQSSSFAGLVSGGATTFETVCDIDQRGVTPFELGKAISMGNMQIISKRKYVVSAGQAFTGQIRDNKNRWLSVADFYASQNNYKYSDWTQSLLFITKPVLFVEGNPTTVRIGVTRTYKYTYEGLNDNKSYYKNQ